MTTATLAWDAVPDDQRGAFRALNLAWITALFELEAEDRRVLDDPEGTIRGPGGEVFFVLDDDSVVATAAVLPHGSTSCELIKMAVADSHKGRGLGHLLMRASIDFARNAGFREMGLVTNAALTPAVTLYHRWGFVDAGDGSAGPWARGDLAMTLDLTRDLTLDLPLDMADRPA